MQKHHFYARFANTPLGERDKLLSGRIDSILHGMTLQDVNQEIKAIDDKIRDDVIRQEKLLRAVEEPLNKVTLTPTQ